MTSTRLLFAISALLILLSSTPVHGFQQFVRKSSFVTKNSQQQRLKRADFANVQRTKLHSVSTEERNVVESQVPIVALSPKVNAFSSVFALGSMLHLSSLFTIWYTFTAAYNVYNAKLKKDFPFPYLTSSMQLLVGTLIYAIPMWTTGLRQKPVLSPRDVLPLLPIAFLNAIGHLCAVISMFGKGGGSFTHVIKASEPLFSVILTMFISGVIPKPMTALSLLPITYGVAYASTLGDLKVSTLQRELLSKAAGMAMISNIAFTLRSILRKNLQKNGYRERTKLDSANENAVTTILSLAILVPLSLVFEDKSNWVNAYQSITDKRTFLNNVVFCGLSYYFANEFQNSILSRLGPVPTAVGNTLKRVVIFVALYAFTSGETFPMPKVVGSAISIAGCMSYAIFDALKK